jgi:hypothetical protein
MKAEHHAVPDLAGLQALLSSARGLVDDLIHDPLLARLITAFFSLPASDREPILKVLERDATWRRIVPEMTGATGIAVHPNPHASLYVHVLDEVTGQPVEPAPSARDVDVIRLGIQRFVPLLPLFFQEGVREQWTRSARELIRAADPALRELAVQLADDVRRLIAEASAEDRA